MGVKKRHMLFFEEHSRIAAQDTSANYLGVQPSFYFKCIRARAALKSLEALGVEISEMDKRVKDAGLQNSSLRSKTKELSEESEAVRAQVEAGHAKQRELLKEFELRKEEKVKLLGNRYELFIIKMDTGMRVLKEKHDILLLLRGLFMLE